MTSITLFVTGADIRAEVNGLLTSGMVGIPVSIRYNEAWSGLRKNLVCRCGQWDPAGSRTRTVLNVGNSAAVAHEVMQPGQTLYLGIEGYRPDGSLVMPTVWAKCGTIHPGANTGADPSAAPTHPIWAQLLRMIGDLDKLETEEKDNLVEAINEAAKTGGAETTIPDSDQNANGLTRAEKDLILALFRNAVYISADMNDTLTQLETLWSESGEDDGGDVHTHSYTASVTTAATCTTAGVRTYTCSCGHSYTESIPATGHSYVNGVCSVCGEVHSHGYTSVITAATCTTDGKQVCTCSCGDSYTVKIPATGHNYVDGVCTVCGAADPSNSPDEPAVTLTGITAVYSAGPVPVETAVSDLTGIVVTAHYSDGTSGIVTGYTLSGTIAEGNNTITVNYGGKIATFIVVGVAESGDEVTGDGTEWTDGVPYEYTLVANEYVGEDTAGTNGFKSYTGWSRTPFLPCKGASSITTTLIAANDNKSLRGAYGCWYDADKKYITYFNQTAANLAAIPSDACFVILSQSDEIMNNIASITPHA